MVKGSQDMNISQEPEAETKTENMEECHFLSLALPAQPAFLYHLEISAEGWHYPQWLTSPYQSSIKKITHRFAYRAIYMGIFSLSLSAILNSHHEFGDHHPMDCGPEMNKKGKVKKLRQETASFLSGHCDHIVARSFASSSFFPHL